MNTNTKYVCYKRHKQASVNRWIGKEVINSTETLEIICEDVHV